MGIEKEDAPVPALRLPSGVIVLGETHAQIRQNLVTAGEPFPVKGEEGWVIAGKFQPKKPKP